MRSTTLRYLPLLAACLLPAGPSAAEPILVADLAPFFEPGVGSDPEPIAAIGSTIYFWGSDDETGHELWRTDGTLFGTELVADICPGRCSSYLGWQNEAVAAGDKLFFTACDGTRGCQLWVTDGSRQGTALVETLGPSFARYSAFQAQNLTVWNGEVYFSAADPIAGVELFRTDGTAAGTVLVKDFRPGLEDTGFISLSAVGERLFVSTTLGLWTTDGSDAGTELLLTLPERVYLQSMQTAVGERLFFTVRREIGNHELWISDGTVDGTLRLREGDFFIQALTAVDDGVFFFEQSNDGVRLWKSDGTVAGTVMVAADIPFGVAVATELDGVLYFASFLRLWRSDGTGAGTAEIFRASGSLGGLVVVGEELFFSINGFSPAPLWRTRGTAETTEPVLEDGAVVYTDLLVVDGRLVLSVDRASRGRELGILDPETGELTMLTSATVYSSGDPRDLVDAGSRLLFLSDGDLYSAAPDPRLPTAELLMPLSPSARLVPVSQASSRRGAFVFDGDLWFAGDAGLPVQLLAGGDELRFRAGPHAVAGELLYFLGSDSSRDAYDLWVSDGTPGGTEMASSSLPANYFCWDPPCAPISLEMQARGEQVFVAHQTIVWRFDPADRSLVAVFDTAELDGCDEFCQVENLAVAGDQVFFTSIGSEAPRILWASDGSVDGSRAVLELASDDYIFSFFGEPPAGSLAPVRELTAFGGDLYFVAAHPEFGEEIWVSDGTAEGTHVVRDIRPGRLSSFPTGLTTYGDVLVFSADPGVGGQELWMSDGTADGTVLFGDFRTGAGSSLPQPLAVVDGLMVLLADDGIDGFEPWVTDLTFRGTRRLADVRGGRLPSSLRELTAVGPYLYFNANAGDRGYELYALPRSELIKPFDDVLAARRRAGELVSDGDR